MLSREVIMLAIVISLEYWNIGLRLGEPTPRRENWDVGNKLFHHSITPSFHGSFYQANDSRPPHGHLKQTQCLLGRN